MLQQRLPSEVFSSIGSGQQGRREDRRDGRGTARGGRGRGERMAGRGVRGGGEAEELREALEIKSVDGFQVREG